MAHRRRVTREDQGLPRSRAQDDCLAVLVGTRDESAAMDLAWTHFNHLIDTYEAEILGDHHTLEKWAELVCVPTG